MNFPCVADLEDKTRWADAVVEADPDGAMQRQSVSGHSPGPVMDEEIVTRLVLDPIHYSKQAGQMLEAFFEDATKFGASVIREVHTTVNDTHERGRERERAIRAGEGGRPPKNHTYLGFARMHVGTVRADASDGLARVYDTALPDFICHADIMIDCRTMSGDSKADKAARKRIRMSLLQHAMEMGGLTPLPND